MQTTNQSPSADQKVETLRRRANTQTDFQSKRAALRAILSASISLPVLTIYTSERVRLEMEAKRRADANFAEYLSQTTVSPQTLDS